MLPVKGYSVNQCVIYEGKDETSKWECQANVISMEDDKNCQSTLCSDKNCKDTKFIHIQPVKPEMKKSSHMQLAKPATLQSDYNKMKSVCDNKNCQSTLCNHMQPLKSARKSNHMWSVRPKMLQSSNKKHSYEVCQIRPVCDDKNSQSAKSMCYDKKSQVRSEGTPSLSM